jgi:hypothetical protein
MNWINKLERKFGKYAIKNLMLYIIALYVLGIIINIWTPAVYDTFLALDAQKILHGQIWRIVTFIIQPPSNTSIIFLFFVLYFYYMIGTVLENIWGAFRFNCYFFMGMIFHVIAAIIIYLVFGINYHMSTYYINLALFMAFAMEQPDMEVMLFFVLPIKIKWLGIFDAVIFAITIIGGYVSLFLSPYTVYALAVKGIVLSPVSATAALVSMINFIVFALSFKMGRPKNATQRNFNKAYKTAKKAEKKRKVSYTERVYNANSEKTTWQTANKPYINPVTGTKHRCAVCGRTELDGDDLTFRFCSKCKGNLEYCQDHLYTHIHVTDENNNKKTN